MIVHVVLFKVKVDASSEKKALMLSRLLELRGKIPGLLEASAGENFSDRARGYTHAYVTRFSDRAALDSYIVHPDHQDVVRDCVKPIVEEVLALDYSL